MNAAEFTAAISGRLVVSCQAPAGHALRDTATLTRIARAAAVGGAAAIRCGGVGGTRDVAALAAAVNVPVIGLTKDGTEGVYITPTVAAALSVAAAGADVVAVDGTRRSRPDRRGLVHTVKAVHDAGRLVLADVATVGDAVAATEAGADLIATTLSGYTADSPVADGPDLDLVEALHARLPGVPIVAEGRFRCPAEAAAALRRGATAVVVGTAITDPAWITARFARALAEAAGPLAPAEAGPPAQESPC